MDEHSGPRIVHLIWLDHDADLASRLNRKAALYAVERLRDLLQCLKALDVGLKTLASRPGRPAETASAAATSTASIVVASTSP